MSEMTIDFFSAAFAKTETGQQEIQKRSLGLSPLVRRVLVLVDGQRSGKDLATFAGDASIDAILGELVEKGCIEAKPREKPEKAEKPAQAAPRPRSKPGVPGALAGPGGALGRAERDGAQLHDQHGQLDLRSAHPHLPDREHRPRPGDRGPAQGLPAVGVGHGENRIGAKRLPELQDKLVNVL